jgi:hypothetical protein
VYNSPQKKKKTKKNTATQKTRKNVKTSKPELLDNREEPTAVG